MLRPVKLLNLKSLEKLTKWQIDKRSDISVHDDICNIVMLYETLVTVEVFCKNENYFNKLSGN